jgi:hypothetical protein
MGSEAWGVFGFRFHFFRDASLSLPKKLSAPLLLAWNLIAVTVHFSPGTVLQEQLGLTA